MKNTTEKILKSMNWRYATKIFDKSKKISKEDLETILEATRLSPTSFGLFHWRAIVVKNKELREKLKEKAWGQTQITDASHLVVFAYKTNINEKYVNEYIELIAKTRDIPKENLDGFKNMILEFLKKMSKESMEIWSAKQAYIALGTMLTTSAMMHIDTCPMEGFDNNAFDEILNLKEKNLKSVVVVSLDYRNEEDKSTKNKKVRFSKEEVFEFID